MPRLTAGEIAAMRAEVIGTQLDHTCTVQRRTQTGVDPNNQPVFSWATVLNAVPCHWWETNEMEVVGGAQALIERTRIVFQANTDVRVTDRVTSVLDNDGDQMVGAAVDIEEVAQALNQVVTRLRVAK